MVWIVGTLLAGSHLRYLAGADLRPGFWPFAAFLLACYSLPFFALTRIRMPERQSTQRHLTLVLFIFIFAISLFIPTRRFLPGYHPAALEGLVYLFLPVFEGGLIALFLVVRAAIATPR